MSAASKAKAGEPPSREIHRLRLFLVVQRNAASTKGSI
jgi:hypothetical protein